jgi:hypothetical protein
MSSLLERIQHLIALSTSPNEHEARNAALLAVRLIRQHGIVLSHPAPARTARRTPGGSRPGVRRVADAVERIRSPLGGDCVRCGQRYASGAEVYWLASGGGMHPRCFEAWAKQK